jgi:hypothetical protein
MKDVTDWLDDNDEHIAKYTAKYYIDLSCLFLFLYTCAMIGFFQYSLIFCIFMVVRYQKIIENRFMGPAQNQVRSNQTLPMANQESQQISYAPVTQPRDHQQEFYDMLEDLDMNWVKKIDEPKMQVFQRT